MELSLLCDCEVALVIISPGSTAATEYASQSIDSVLATRNDALVVNSMTNADVSVGWSVLAAHDVVFFDFV
jgi:hypothetical protein